MIRFWPPSSSGLGRRPFTAVARVRIPLGVRDAVTRSSSKALWRSWLARRPVTAEVAGSSPVRVAKRGEALAAFRPGSSVGTSVRLKSGRSPVRSRPWPPSCLHSSGRYNTVLAPPRSREKSSKWGQNGARQDQLPPSWKLSSSESSAVAMSSSSSSNRSA